MEWEARREGNPFRAGLAALFGGLESPDPQSIVRLAQFRLCEQFDWTFDEISSVPSPVLALCHRLRWSYAQLMGTPQHVIRDFLVILDLEREATQQQHGDS